MNDLFESRSIWITSPEVAFGSFIQSKEFIELSKRKPKASKDDSDELNDPGDPLRQSTLKIYTLMFGKFVRWANKRNYSDITKLTGSMLIEFLDSADQVRGKKIPKPDSAIRHRYLRLFERIYTHLQIKPNPATEALAISIGKFGRDAPKIALTMEQQIRFLRNLPNVPYDGIPGSQGWRLRRDRAIQAILLGAGLKVSEAIGLHVENISDVDTNGSISVTVSPGSVSGTSRWHQTQLRSFAVIPVLEWLEERQAMKLPHRILFPSSLTKGVKLSKVQIYRMVNSTFERAGIHTTHSGGRILRNSYAARELSTDDPNIELVKELLGLYKLRSAQMYLPKKPIHE